MILTEHNDTLDLFVEVEKWYEDSYTNDDWISAFTRKNMDGTLQELDDYIFIETANTSLDNISTSSEITNKTDSTRCLMDDFEVNTHAFHLDALHMYSTPKSIKNHIIGELRSNSQPIEEYGILPNTVHQEIISDLDAYTSYSSGSVESLTLTKPRKGENVPELEYTSCSSLDNVDSHRSPTSYIEYSPPNPNEYPFIDPTSKYRKKSSLQLENKHILHIPLSLSHFEMII